MSGIKLLMLHLQRMALCAEIRGQMDVLKLPLDSEYRTRVLMAHANAEASLLEVDAQIRKLQRGAGLMALEA